MGKRKAYHLGVAASSKTPFFLVIVVLLAGCATSPSSLDTQQNAKSEIQLAIEKVCSHVTSSQIVDIYSAREAISELVQLDGSYMPILEEMANFFSVMREKSNYPKQYPDLQLLKSFCSSVDKNDND